jgi:hypothetical protein
MAATISAGNWGVAGSTAWRGPAVAPGSADRAMGPSPTAAANIKIGMDLRPKACLTAISFAGEFDAAPEGRV